MFYEAARSANTPADRSKRATQLSPGAALPALCLLLPGRLGDPVHGMRGLVYGTGEKYDPVHGSGYLVYGIVESASPYTESGVWCAGQESASANAVSRTMGSS